MAGMLYPPRVQTVDEIRLSNYKRLLQELRDLHGRDPKQTEVAEALGISAPYVNQIARGKRKRIEGAAARKMEALRGKEPGWMDNDAELWPFETITSERFARLPERQKGMAEQEVRRIVEEWEALGGGSGSQPERQQSNGR